MPSWILPSDTHVAGDSGHTVDHNHIVDDLTVLRNSQTGWVNAVTQFGATTSGDSTAAIQAALLSFGTLAGWTGAGGTVYLPPGDYSTSKPLILPSGVWLAGDGWSSIVDLTIGSNCDIIQFSHIATATTLSSGISGTITSIPVAALGAPVRPGTVQVSNGTNTQNFTTSGAAQGATSIPVSSTAVSFTFTAGNTVTDITQLLVIQAVPGYGSTTAAGIGNAFYAGIEKVQLHGDSFHTTVAGYNHGISITPSPSNSTGSGDPEFDPLPTVRDVYIKAVTGDGINHFGRSGACFERVYSAFHNGCAFVPSYDTTMVDCLAAFSGAGFYLNHGSNTGTGCKSYNNNDYTWVSGHSYAPNSFGGIHTMAISGGVMYFCIAATSGTTAPGSDPTHWTAVSATSVAANGTCWYFDANAGEHSWAACDAQEPSTSSFYFKGPNSGGSGIIVQATSSEVNFNNGQPAWNAANPNNYAHVVLDGAQGATVQVATSGTAARNPVLCTLLNSPGNNTLTATTDGSEAIMFSGGTPAFALVNAQLYASAGIKVNTALVTPPVTLTLAATVAVNAALGNDFRLTLTASGDTIGNPANSADGQVIRFQIAQDGTGSRTVSWGTNYDFGAAGTPTLSTGASKVDVIGFCYNASLSKWIYLGSALGA